MSKQNLFSRIALTRLKFLVGRRRRRAKTRREVLDHDVGDLGEDARGDSERGEHVLQCPKGHPLARPSRCTAHGVIRE